MNITKKEFIKNISKNSSISLDEAAQILDSFLALTKNRAKTNAVKLSGFGTFKYKLTPERVGRNPKTGATYTINSFKRLTFNPSFKIKKTLNWYNNLKLI